MRCSCGGVNIWRLLVAIVVPFLAFWFLSRNSLSLFNDARLLSAQDSAKKLGKFTSLTELDKQIILDPPLTLKAQIILILGILTYVSLCYFYVRTERDLQEKKRFEVFFNNKNKDE